MSVLAALSPEGLNLFSRDQQCCCLRHSLLISPDLLLELLDFSLVLGSEPFKLLLLFQGKCWFFICILGCLAPSLHLPGGQAPLAELGAELGGVQHSGSHHYRLLTGGSTALRVLLERRHYLSLQSPGFPPVVEGVHVNFQLLGKLSDVLIYYLIHAPSHIGFAGLAVTAYCAPPSSPRFRDHSGGIISETRVCD
jgi:hypothetical protein